MPFATPLFILPYGKLLFPAHYPMLTEAGAVLIEAALERPETGRPRLQGLKPTATIVLLANGSYLAPVVIPVFPPGTLLSHARHLPTQPTVNQCSHAPAAPPRWYFDQFRSHRVF